MCRRHKRLEGSNPSLSVIALKMLLPILSAIFKVFCLLSESLNLKFVCSIVSRIVKFKIVI